MGRKRLPPRLSRLVEAYRLHPNAIKALARCEPRYSLSDEGLPPVAY